MLLINFKPISNSEFLEQERIRVQEYLALPEVQELYYKKLQEALKNNSTKVVLTIPNIKINL